MSESSGTVRVSRTSKSHVTFKEVAQDGAFCMLENNSSSDFDLSGMVIERKHRRGTATFVFPSGSKSKLRSGSSVKIFAYDFKAEAGSGDFVGDEATCRTWSTGNGDYKLLDGKKELCAYKLEYSGR